ncbi:MAG: hypothetical protein V3R98_14990 [Alphaproteobacteria bacterium]
MARAPFQGSAHDAVGQLMAEVERLRTSNERLLGALRRVVDAYDSRETLPEAVESARNEVVRALKGR